MPDPNAITPSNETRGGGQIPTAEWLVAAIGLIIVGAAIFVLLQEALAGDRSPPDIRLKVGAISASGTGYLVQFSATNAGGQTAAEVVIEGTHSAEAEEEKSQATFDFLPPRSERRGGLLFRHDPRTPQGSSVELRALGYREP